ncbi:MAG: hypothetical protein O7B99_03305, partial [Planctomycetota bacterium]|nr:hypothetical protein [Planctomycetota bacterium]
ASMTSVVDFYFGGIGFGDGAADFTTSFSGTPVVLAVPVSAVGLDIYSQGGVLHLADLTAYHTNRVRTSLLP